MTIAKPSPAQALRALVAVTSCIAAGKLQAETITAPEAAAALIEHTWHGRNSEGQAYWFYHERDGRAVARFEPGFAGKQTFSLSWRVEDGARICWYWDYGKTDCYHAFDHAGDTITMTRSDGVAHSGVLHGGKSERI